MGIVQLKVEKEAKLTCIDCGMELLLEDEGCRWGYCRFCGKPVCFSCTHYLGVSRKGMYMDEYVEVIRLCKKCHIEKK